MTRQELPLDLALDKPLSNSLSKTPESNDRSIVIPSSDLNTLRIIDRVVWSGHPMI
mgnify:CR=1 FL=1